MTRTEARLIAEELHKLLRKDIKSALAGMTAAETEEYLSAKQAASLLGWSVRTLYNRIEDIPHTKQGKHLRFRKSAIIAYLERR